ncbi:L,D-transpeptidase [Oceaniglobus roseus]|uniref:L,D-transpeptidase n=1 Tax=Oceaniglobus roseus TaxID=1737570 RepID=UPI001FE8C8C1|nr:L,D-transpeptidase [Kandeliimicrobium roseum]
MHFMTRRMAPLFALLISLALAAPLAAAPLEVRVDISQQRMVVKRDGKVVGDWPVSTARKGKVTPTGTFRPQALKKTHYSSLYDNAPMPYSIFFRGNYAIHGTNQVKRLGRPASAGCVRLSTGNAKKLFAMVQQVGMKGTRITVVR